MNDINFIDRVKKHFAYMQNEYGFHIVYESNSDSRPQTDGVVEYASNTTGILIDSETGYVTVRFYRKKDGKKYYLTPVDIYEYLNTSDKEKELLLSTTRANRTLASALFNEKFLLNQPGWKGSHATVSNLDTELENFSNWLKRHTSLFLEGDFSQWPKFYEYKIRRAQADQLRRGKDDLVYVRIKDVDGKYKLIKQSIFKDDFECIEKLKKEFSI